MNSVVMEPITIIMVIFTLVIGKWEKTWKGIFSWKSGNTYEGIWVEGKRSGVGVMTMKNGEKWAVRVLDLPD